MESSSDEVVSLSDLSISDSDRGSEYEDELKVPEVEPSTWAEIRNFGSGEAANRLADMSHHTLLSTSFAPPVDASVNASTNKALDNNSEKNMNCCGRATVALGLEQLCLLLHGSALKAPSGRVAQHTYSSEPAEKQRASWGSNAGEDYTRNLLLDAVSLKCIETRVGRGAKHSKSARVATANEQPESANSSNFTSNEIPAQIDPKLFLSCKDANATIQALVEELNKIVRVHANEAMARQNLVCKHFEQFINCKNTIDDIRRHANIFPLNTQSSNCNQQLFKHPIVHSLVSVLRRSFAEEIVNSSATGNLIASIDDAIDFAYPDSNTYAHDTR